MSRQDLGAFQGFPAEDLQQTWSEMGEQTEDRGQPEDSQGSQPARTRIPPLSKSKLRKLRGKRAPREKTSPAQEASQEASLPSDWTRTRLEGAEELPLNRRKRKIALRRTLIQDRAASLASTEETAELSREDLEKGVQERSMRARIQPHAFGKQVESKLSPSPPGSNKTSR